MNCAHKLKKIELALSHNDVNAATMLSELILELRSLGKSNQDIYEFCTYIPFCENASSQQMLANQRRIFLQKEQLKQILREMDIQHNA